MKTISILSRLVCAITLTSLAVAFNLGCTKKSTETATAPAAAKELNLAIWGNYLAPDVVEKFTAATGIKLNVSNYSSNEELLAKIQSGASGVDVAVPSDYMVAILAKSGLLEKLNSEKLPNKGQINPEFLGLPFDPTNEFSLPYAWSTAGLAVNKDLVKGELKSWKQFFENKDLSGKISMLDDVREVTAAALKANGFSVNTTNSEELNKAKKTLLAVKPRLKMFRTDTIDALVNKEIAVAHAYSSDALKAVARSGGAIVYIIPEEGGTRAVDNLVIVKGAKNIDNAHAFINFVLSPESNLSLVTQMKAGPVLTATRDLLPQELKTNEGLFPSSATLSKMEALKDVGDKTQLYDQLWTEVKTN
jgi:spermidine/putrescine transport system substrate-binding protein